MAIEEKVKLDFIRYSNCWEDADVLLKGLNPREGSRIISIASGGDNSFALLSSNPEKVVTIDISEVQLFLCELKKAAFQHLEYEEVLAFTGITNSRKRLYTYGKISPSLSSGARHWWDNHLTLIEKGIVHIGKFERYFTFFRKWILPLIHSRKNNLELFKPKSQEEQTLFYDKKWNTWRWKLFFKMFFSEYVMGKFGRDPEFMKHVTVPVSTFIYDKAAKHLQTVDCQSNYLLQYIHLGCFDTTLPFYLRKENFSSIKSNLKQLEFRKENLLDELKGNNFTHLNLSNIFEYISTEEFKNSALYFHQHLPKGSKLFYWNLMCPRSFAEVNPEKFILHKTSEIPDMGFFYLRSILEETI